MVAILEKVEIYNMDAGGNCNLFHHGIVKDYIEIKYFEMKAGNLYGIIGEFGNGGAALSCCISGDTNFHKGEIIIDGEITDITTLAENSWYIGNDLRSNKSKRFMRRKPRFQSHTIKDQIQAGINNHSIQYDCDAICKLFKISPERAERNIEFVSGERWRASVAIGFSHGKSIFCYPWLNTQDIERNKMEMINTINTLIDHNKIIILPTTKEENVAELSNRVHFLTL